MPRSVRRRPVVNIHSDDPRFRQILDHVLDQIAAGALKPGQRLPPLRDWAEEVGASYETVRKAVRELVAQGALQTMPRRGTTVSPFPQNRKRVGTVGLVTETPLLELFRSHYYRALLPILQDELMPHHERVTHERWTPRRRLAEMFDCLRLVDAIVLIGNAPYPVAQILAVERQGVPVLFVGGELEDKRVWIIRSDDHGDCRHAVAQMVKMGYTSIAAWCGGKEDPRLKGYVEGLRDANLPYRDAYVFTEYGCDVAGQIASLDPRPQALFIMRHMDRVEGLLTQLRSLGIQPGYDLYLCSYDDDLWNNLAPQRIPYAHIEQQSRETARRAAQIILDRLGGKPVDSVHTFLQSRFIAVPGPRIHPARR